MSPVRGEARPRARRDDPLWAFWRSASALAFVSVGQGVFSGFPLPQQLLPSVVEVGLNVTGPGTDLHSEDGLRGEHGLLVGAVRLGAGEVGLGGGGLAREALLGEGVVARRLVVLPFGPIPGCGRPARPSAPAGIAREPSPWAGSGPTGNGTLLRSPGAPPRAAPWPCGSGLRAGAPSPSSGPKGLVRLVEVQRTVRLSFVQGCSRREVHVLDHAARVASASWILR